MARIAMARIDMTRDVAPQLTMTVTMVGMKKWVVRLWVATQLMKLAAWIMNMGIKIEDTPWYSADL